MALAHSFTCPLPYGLHARPASALEEVTRRYASTISIVNRRTGESANAKSVLGIVGLDVRLDDECTVTIEGTDESAAAEALLRFIETGLAHCDDALAPPVEPAGPVSLPPVLHHAAPRVLHGTAVVPGIGRGRALRIGGRSIPDALINEPVVHRAFEIAQLEKGLQALDDEYTGQLANDSSDVATAVLRAHHAIARDPALREQLLKAVRAGGRNAAGAIGAAEAHFSAILAASGSSLLRERALDVRDVCMQLCEKVYGPLHHPSRPRLTADAVCIAKNLTPGELLALDRRFLRGLVLEHAASTSHSIVLARSFGIPTITGVTGLGEAALDGTDVVVDADLGVLVTTQTARVRRYYEMEESRLVRRRERLRVRASEPAVTTDGARVEIGANISVGDETAGACSGGADGVGLFRTEMLFMNREEAPGEEEQFTEYRRALEGAAGRPVIIRTLDVGGDKPLPYLRLPAEDNPFLGWRAVRMYGEFDALVRTQVRALVRASAFGQLRVMVPMISRLHEARLVKRMVAEEQAKCEANGTAYSKTMEVGAMVEIPAMAMQLDHFARELDFFSIGTNDLLQYFFAVDRSNEKIADLYDPLAPPFIRLLKKIVDDSHAVGRWVGVCGEFGGEPAALPLWVGLGVDELSMAATRIAAAKADVRLLRASACRTLVERTIACAEPGEVKALLETFDGRQPQPLIAPDLIMLDTDCATREEAVKTLVDQLYVTGRTEQPRDVETAVWQREAKYSTGFGSGFAIPHCRTDAVTSNSLAILRLKRPVAWNSADEKVSVLILLAIRESDEATAHLRILASLARRLMHEEFRERIVAEQDAEALCGFLGESVGR